MAEDRCQRPFDFLIQQDHAHRIGGCEQGIELLWICTIDRQDEKLLFVSICAQPQLLQHIITKPLPKVRHDHQDPGTGFPPAAKGFRRNISRRLRDLLDPLTNRLTDRAVTTEKSRSRCRRYVAQFRKFTYCHSVTIFLCKSAFLLFRRTDHIHPHHTQHAAHGLTKAARKKVLNIQIIKLFFAVLTATVPEIRRPLLCCDPMDPVCSFVSCFVSVLFLFQGCTVWVFLDSTTLIISHSEALQIFFCTFPYISPDPWQHLHKQGGCGKMKQTADTKRSLCDDGIFFSKL